MAYGTGSLTVCVVCVLRTGSYRRRRRRQENARTQRLKDQREGLVQARRQGREVRYSLVAERLEELHNELSAYLQHLITVHKDRSTESPTAGTSKS